MPAHIARERGLVIRAPLEHVFSNLKHRIGLVVRAIDIARALLKIGVANLASNFSRLAWPEGKRAPA